jgi:hypothetical protein
MIVLIWEVMNENKSFLCKMDIKFYLFFYSKLKISKECLVSFGWPYLFFIGLRLGKIYDVTSPVPYEPSFQWTITCPFFVPKRLVSIGLVQLYLDQFDYGIDKAFKQLNCKSKVRVFIVNIVKRLGPYSYSLLKEY